MRHLVQLSLSLALVLACGLPALAQSDPDGNLAVTADIQPLVAKVGEPLTLFATVTNVGTEPATFGHDGCPLRYTIDGVFSPPWGCAEFWTQVTLQPGESITFPAQGQDDVILVHTADLYPLSPGEHLFTLTVGSAGGTRMLMQVEEPDSNQAYAGGRVIHADGSAAAHVDVYLQPYNDLLNAVLYHTVTGEAGYFLFDPVPPGPYLLSATAGNVRTWYPGTKDPNQAQPLRLFGYRDDLVLPLDGGPPPPEGTFGGIVYEMTDRGQQTPLPGAWVAAVPVGWGLDIRQAEGDFDPPPPVYTANTGKDGSFYLPVPGGQYKVFAGRFPAHDYIYALGAKTWDAAEVLDPFSRRHTLTFAVGSMSSGAHTTFSGQVLAYDPYTDGPPQPLADVTVLALAVVPLPYETLVIPQARTDENGRYNLQVFSGTPYFLQFTKDGYEDVFYGNAPSRSTAQGVDAHAGETVDHLDALLQPSSNYNSGGISGFVMEQGVCADGFNCDRPLAGAQVRVTPAYPTFAPYVRTAVTDSAGYFEVTDLAASEDGSLSYYVRADAPGHTPSYYPGGVPYEQAEPLPVYPIRTSDAGTIFLPPETQGGGVIAGTVQQRDGTPLAGVHVMLFPQLSGIPYEQPVPYRPGPIHTVTDGQGAFVVAGLQDMAYIPAFSLEGYIPGYYAGRADLVYRWIYAKEVSPADSEARSVQVTMHRALGDGPYIQAGRVENGGAYSDSTFSLAMARSPREIALAYHRQNLADAFFYLVSAEATGPAEFIVAGGETENNGTVILTDLPQGGYYAYADRPGFNTAYFVSASGSSVPLFLGPTTPAVLAEIVLNPLALRASQPPPIVHNLTSKPNPFRLDTGISIQFTLEMPENVTVEIYDAQGRRVRRLGETQFLTGGDYTIPWDGFNQHGEQVPAGVYFYRVLAGKTKASNKIVVLP